MILKSNELALHTNENEPTIEFYHSNPLINAGPGIVLVKDINHAFIASNPFFSKFSGIQPNYLQGLNDLDMPWAEQSDLYISHENEVLSGESYSVIEPLDGLARSVLYTAKEVILDQYGNPAGTRAMAMQLNHPVDFENIISVSKTKKVASYGDYKLSQMETKVLYLLLHGIRRAKIAEKLNTSVVSIDTYLRRIRIKLGVSSNVTLIEKCVFLGFHETFPFQLVA